MLFVWGDVVVLTTSVATWCHTLLAHAKIRSMSPTQHTLANVLFLEKGAHLEIFPLFNVVLWKNNKAYCAFNVAENVNIFMRYRYMNK